MAAVGVMVKVMAPWIATAMAVGMMATAAVVVVTKTTAATTMVVGTDKNQLKGAPEKNNNGG